MELGKQIKNCRQEANLSQEELAERVYVSRQTISNWENDKSYPDVNSLVLLSEVFHISLDKLIKGDIDRMREEIKKEEVTKLNRYSRVYGILIAATLLSAVPMAKWLGWWFFLPWGLLYATAMYFALKVEKVESGQTMITTEDLIIAKDGQVDTVEYVCVDDFVIGDYLEMAPSLITMNDDIINMPFFDMECMYNGDLFGNKTGNFIVQMSTKGFVDGDNVLDVPGVCLIMNFFTKFYSGNAEPVLTEGTYNVSTMNAASLFKQGTLLPGILMDGTPFGTYFFQNTKESGGEVSPEFINSGYVTVKYDEEVVSKGSETRPRACTLTYDLSTSRRKVSGVWKGELLVTNLAPGSTESTLSTLSEDVHCDMSKVTGGTLRKIETLHRDNIEEIWNYDIAEAWQLYLQPRDWTAEEKDIPWVDPENEAGADGIIGTEDDWMWDKDKNGKRDRLEAWCADGDYMILEFVLPLGSNGEIAPELNKEYTYTMQPNLSVEEDNYEIYVSRMGRPADEIFDPKYAEQYPGWAEGMNLTGYDRCNARRGFTWSEDGFRGNWYMHNKEGEHFMIDGHAPAINGWVKVKRTAEKTYDFSWEFIDDNPGSPNTITGSISNCNVEIQL